MTKESRTPTHTDCVIPACGHEVDGSRCLDCAALFEGPGRRGALAGHFYREHSDDAISERAQVAIDAADELLGALAPSCDAGDPCPHPNLQPREHRYGGSRGDCVVCGTFPCLDPLMGNVVCAGGDMEPPLERPDWMPDWSPLS